MPNEQAALEYVYNRKLRWKIIDEDLPDDIPKYRIIYKCPDANCNYVVNNPNSLAYHIKLKHRDIDDLRRELGLLWASIISYAKTDNKLLSGKDLYNTNDACLCLRCNHFIGPAALEVFSSCFKCRG